MTDLTEHFHKLEQPQKRGQATEALLKSQFVVRDVAVLIPEYNNEPYDFVIEISGSFYRIQAKTAYEGVQRRNGVVRDSQHAQ